MQVRMQAVQLVGSRPLLREVLTVLHGLRLVQLAEPSGGDAGKGLDRGPGADAGSGADRVDPTLLRHRVGELERLLEAAAGVGLPARPGARPSAADEAGPDDAQDAAEDSEEVTREVARLDQRLRALAAEQESLPRFRGSMAALLPLVPELAELSEARLAALRLSTIALVLEDHDDRLVGLLREQLREELGDRALLVATRTAPDTVGALVVLSTGDDEVVHQILGRDQVAHLALPEGFSGHSLAGLVRELDERIAALPGQVESTRDRLRSLLAPRLAGWADELAGVRTALDVAEAQARAGLTERTFALRGWLPAGQLDRLQAELADRFGPRVLVSRRRPGAGEIPPVLLRNPRRWTGFERLVGFLSLPRSGTLDPTGLMALALPLLFGIMVGDLGYGLGLLLIGLGVRRRYRVSNPFVADLARILVIGGAWSMVFGLLFGELFGSLGKTLGMPALWFYRGGPEALAPLLLFALAVGAVHIVLGLLLGVFQEARDRHLRGVLERVSVLLVLSGLFLLAGVAGARLPDAVVTPAVALAMVGLVLACTLHGALGLLLGPLELLGSIGNVLSYLRLAAVGLASVYLANVANELAAAAPLWLGVLVAVFFHTLNLALAAFSPMIQSLRLHYVEFFRTFYLDGGLPFRPFGAGPDEPAGPAAGRPVPASPAPVAPIPATPDPEAVPAGTGPASAAGPGPSGRPAVAGVQNRGAEPLAA